MIGKGGKIDEVCVSKALIFRKCRCHNFNCEIWAKKVKKFGKKTENTRIVFFEKKNVFILSNVDFYKISGRKYAGCIRPYFSSVQIWFLDWVSLSLRQY